MEFEDFFLGKLESADITYWQPYKDVNFVVCAIKLDNGFVVSGDSSGDPSNFLCSVTTAGLKECAKEAAAEKLKTYLVHEYYCAEIGDEQGWEEGAYV